MIEALSQPVTFYAFFTASGQGKTGLTVTIDVYRGTTALVSGGAATEVGGGLYRYTLASGSTGSAEGYAAVFKTADTSVDQRHVPSLWVVGLAWVQTASHLALAAIAGGVWDESLTGHASSGSAGAALALADLAGEGDTPVDHNTGGTDNLRYLFNGVGADGAVVRAYLKSDFDSHVYAERGRSTTASDGRWATPMYLSHGLTYAFVCSKPGASQVSRRDVTV